MKKVQLKRSVALAWIVGSTFLVTGLGNKIIRAHFREESLQAEQLAHSIAYIVQTGPQKEALKTVYLAELLGIAADHPTHLLRFDLKRAKAELLASPLIKEACVKKLSPNGIYVDYTVRQPLAAVYDYTNTAVDEEGFLFPLAPFFPPKNLPEIYFGMSAYAPLTTSSSSFRLAVDLLKLFQEPSYRDFFHIKRIDVSSTQAKLYRDRGIVVITEDEMQGVPPRKIERILRLSVKNYAQELGNYLELREKFLQEERKDPTISSRVIDFRSPQLAYTQTR